MPEHYLFFHNSASFSIVSQFISLSGITLHIAILKSTTNPAASNNTPCRSAILTCPPICTPLCMLQNVLKDFAIKKAMHNTLHGQSLCSNQHRIKEEGVYVKETKLEATLNSRLPSSIFNKNIPCLLSPISSIFCKISSAFFSSSTCSSTYQRTTFSVA